MGFGEIVEEVLAGFAEIALEEGVVDQQVEGEGEDYYEGYYEGLVLGYEGVG